MDIRIENTTNEIVVTLSENHKFFIIDVLIIDYEGRSAEYKITEETFGDSAGSFRITAPFRVKFAGFTRLTFSEKPIRRDNIQMRDIRNIGQSTSSDSYGNSYNNGYGDAYSGGYSYLYSY